MLFPLSASHPPWLYVEMVLLAPLGAIYSGFVYEKAVLHMGDYRARLRGFFEQTERSKKGAPELPPEKEGFTYFTYALLGRRIGKALGLFKSLKGTLSMGGMKVGYKAYVSLMVFSSIVGLAKGIILLSPF